MQNRDIRRNLINATPEQVRAAQQAAGMFKQPVSTNVLAANALHTSAVMLDKILKQKRFQINGDMIQLACAVHQLTGELMARALMGRLEQADQSDGNGSAQAQE